MSIRTSTDPATGGSPGAAAPTPWKTEENGGQQETLRYSKLLVATDGSAAALRAGGYAARLARRLGAKLYILNVVNIHWTFIGGVHYGEAVRELTRTGREATAEIKALADQDGVECEELIVEGDPARAIVGVAEEVDADCVLLGRETRSRLEGVLFGDVSQDVLRLSSRPVLVAGSGHPTVAESAYKQKLEVR